MNDGHGISEGEQRATFIVGDPQCSIGVDGHTLLLVARQVKLGQLLAIESQHHEHVLTVSDHQQAVERRNVGDAVDLVDAGDRPARDDRLGTDRVGLGIRIEGSRTPTPMPRLPSPSDPAGSRSVAPSRDRSHSRSGCDAQFSRKISEDGFPSRVPGYARFACQCSRDVRRELTLLCLSHLPEMLAAVSNSRTARIGVHYFIVASAKKTTRSTYSH